MKLLRAPPPPAAPPEDAVDAVLSPPPPPPPAAIRMISTSVVAVANAGLVQFPVPEVKS